MNGCVRLVGFNAENGKKLLFTIIFVVLVILSARALHLLQHRLLRDSVIMRGRTFMWATGSRWRMREDVIALGSFKPRSWRWASRRQCADLL